MEIKKQLLKHLEVWEDFKDLVVHSSVYSLVTRFMQSKLWDRLLLLLLNQSLCNM